MMTRALLAAVFSLWLTTSAWAGLEEGMAAYDRGEYRIALSQFRPLAEQGDVDAQVKLSTMYFNGYGVLVDPVEGFKWALKAAEQGHAEAQHAVGFLYSFSNDYDWLNISRPEGLIKAAIWVRKAAEQGLIEAQMRLADIYDIGQGVPKNTIAAIKWWGLAAEQSNDIALFQLKHSMHQGAPEEKVEATKWIRKLAENGQSEAQYQLAITFDIDDTQKTFWFKKAAEQGHAEARNRLGSLYDAGIAVLQDYVEASKWFRLAAEQGDANSQRELGERYKTGKGVPQDYVLAHMWYNLAAAQGWTYANESRDEIARFMTPAQVAEAQRLAREWQPSALMEVK